MAAGGAFQVSHESDGEDAEAGQGQPVWAELLADGLTYDLVGLAPGTGVGMMDGAQRFGLREEQGLLDCEAIELRPGPHIVDGIGLPPVYRSLMAVGLALAGLDGVVAVGWGGANTLMAPAYFTRIVGEWLAGGVFPALGLTAMVGEVDGGLQTRGLAMLAGHELRVEPSVAEDAKARAHVAVRLVDELVRQGVFVPEDGRRTIGELVLDLRLSRNGRFIRAFPASTEAE